MKEELCEKVDVLGFKNGCYMHIAESKDNKILCEKISSPGIESLCTGEPIYIKEENGHLTSRCSWHVTLADLPFWACN